MHVLSVSMGEFHGSLVLLLIQNNLLHLVMYLGSRSTINFTMMQLLLNE